MMLKKPYHSLLDACFAILMRGVVASLSRVLCPLGVRRPFVDDKASEGNHKKLFLGYSWFRSVRSCLKVTKAGHHSCFILSKATQGAPSSF